MEFKLMIKKVEDIIEWPTPSNFNNIQTFHGHAASISGSSKI